jgi:hypothetical protein
VGEGALEGRSESGRYALRLALEPSRPAAGALFAVVTTVRDVLTDELIDGARLEVDATMPEHGHGMMTRPVHEALGGGRYRSEGLKLHMPGRWELVARLQLEERVDELRLPVRLRP